MTRIMVVVDDDALRDAIARALGPAGLWIEQAADGRQALERLEELDRDGDLPKLMLLDWDKLRSDCAVVVSVVRSSYPWMVLVAISADLRRIPLVDGALVKPMRLPVLVSVVLELTA